MIFRTIVFSNSKDKDKIFLNEIYTDEAEMDADDIIRVLSYYTTKQDYLVQVKEELILALREDNSNKVHEIIKKAIMEIM